MWMWFGSMTRAYSRVCNPSRKLFGNAAIAVLGDASALRWGYIPRQA